MVGWPSFQRPDSVNERDREQGQRERNMVYLQKHWFYYATVMVKPWYFDIPHFNCGMCASISLVW